MSLMVFGTVALDDLKAPAGVKKNLLGGSASHFSMSASLFTKVHLAGIIGSDFPERHMKLFARKKIDTAAVVRAKGKTFHWYGKYEKGNFNNAITLKTELGVIADYKPVLNAAQKKMPNVFLANIDPVQQMRFLKAMDNPKFVGMDSMNLWIATMKKDVKKLMKKVHLFVVNDGEASALTGETNIIKAAKALRRMGPPLVVVKKGEHGVLFCCDKFLCAFPAFPIEKVIDPTGAGDTFAGGLMGYLSKQKKLTEQHFRRALMYATVCSSYNVEGFSNACTSGLTSVKLNSRLTQFRKFIAG